MLSHVQILKNLKDNGLPLTLQWVQRGTVGHSAKANALHKEVYPSGVLDERR